MTRPSPARVVHSVFIAAATVVAALAFGALYLCVVPVLEPGPPPLNYDNVGGDLD
jgi:hypothetical protein